MKTIAEGLYTINKEAKLIRDVKADIFNYLVNGTQLEESSINYLQILDDGGVPCVYDEWDIKYYSVKEVQDEIDYYKRNLDYDDIDDEYKDYCKTIIESLTKTLFDANRLFNEILCHDYIRFDLREKQDQLYKIKKDVLNKLNLKPIDYHLFGDGKIRPLYQYCGLLFHGESLCETDITDNIENDAKEIENYISSENKVKTMTCEEAMSVLTDFINN